MSPHGWFLSTTGDVVISHHGADAASTRDGYRRAYDLGYRWFQADLVPVADDLIVLHSVLGWKWGYGRKSLDEIRRKHPKVATVSDLLDDPLMPDARWNLEVKSPRTVPLLKKLLHARADPAAEGDDLPAIYRVMVSAPLYRSIGRDLRRMFGDRIAVCAPVVYGGAFDRRLWCPPVPYDSRQVHRWFAPRIDPEESSCRPPIGVWTVRTGKQLGEVLSRKGQHAIVSNTDAHTRAYLQERGRWPELPPRPPADPEEEETAKPTVAVHPGEPVKRVFLGGGGWRGAFGAIGAVMYLECSGRWQEVDDVVAISGGSFVAGILGAAGARDADPAPLLADLTDRLLAMEGPVRRGLGSLGLLVPLVVVPPLLFGMARTVMSRRWRRVLERSFPERPCSTDGRRVIICAAGRESARPYLFVSGVDKTCSEPQGQIVPKGWRTSDAIRASTALPWVNGYRVPDNPDGDSPYCGRGEVLIDGGILGIFGSHVFEQSLLLPSLGDDQHSLIVDAGRSHRRGGRTSEWIARTSTVVLLGRWIQIGLDGSFQHALRETGNRPLSVHLVRVAEPDPHEPRRDGPLRRLEHGRRIVHGFGLTGLSEANALTTIVVAVVACMIEFEDEAALDTIEDKLADIGTKLGLEHKLVELWQAL